MIRVLSILAVVTALTVSSAAVASASGTGSGVGSDHAWGTHHFKAVAAAPVASAGPNTLKNAMVTGFGVKAAPPKPPSCCLQSEPAPPRTRA